MAFQTSSPLQFKREPNYDETLHVMIYVLSIVLKDRTAKAPSLQSGRGGAKIVEALEQKYRRPEGYHTARLREQELEAKRRRRGEERRGEGRLSPA